MHLHCLCLDDGNFASWASWGECTSQCEGVMYKTRDCQVTEEDACDSLTNATISCNTQPCPGELSPGQTGMRVDIGHGVILGSRLANVY